MLTTPMHKLLTTTIITEGEMPNLENTFNFFDALCEEGMDVEILKHPEYESAWVVTINYCLPQAKLFSELIGEYMLLCATGEFNKIKFKSIYP